MFENDRKETASKAVTSIRHQNNIEKSTWKTHRYVINFESRITLKFPRRIVITISTWIHLSKSMKSRRTFHVEFRRCVYWVRNVFEKKKKKISKSRRKSSESPAVFVFKWLAKTNILTKNKIDWGFIIQEII